jgi:phosphoglycerol transferase MdoB-like AlkP superfamily enzyme
MEPLDTDLEYVRSGPSQARPGSRYNVMLFIPILGFLLVLILIGAAVFQWDLSQLIDSLIGLFLVMLVVIIALLFWAGAPGSHEA